jgi:ABC-type phosphate/phosphonate transport system substrate-binding protein
MKKVFTLLVAILFVFTLSSCTNEEVEVTIIIYSEDYQQLLSDLEGLPELIGIELQGLGYEFDRIVLQSSNNMALIESSLNDGQADVAIVDPTMIQDTSLVRVLDVVKEEVNHPAGDMDNSTYQKAIVSASTVNGITFQTLYEGIPTYTDLNGLNVCSVFEDRTLIVDFAIALGATSISDVTINQTTSSQRDVYISLEDGTCDLGIITLEDVDTYKTIWDDNDQTIYQDISVLYTFEPMLYEGLYVSQEADVALTNALTQAFIQIASNYTNQEILAILGHQGYAIPEK